ncbi:MAG: hypothetical protein HC945_01630 [Nitrosarchaeum sp.]|nr:hypothetical protein [Nitrosarchaeum sp.]
MNMKEQTPLYIVGIVAVVAIVVLVLAIGANAGGAFSFRGAGTGYSGSATSMMDMLSRMGFTLDQYGNLVGDCDNPELEAALGGDVYCDPASQTATLPNGRTIKFGGLNAPAAQMNRICCPPSHPA